MANVTVSGTAEIDSVRMKEQAGDPATPASSYGQLYIKSDGVYFKGDGGTVIGPLVDTSTGIGDVGAKTQHSGNQTITTSTNTILNWDAEVYDTSGFHDDVTNNTRLTVPANGKYLIGCTLTWASNSTGDRVLALRKNGTDLLVGDARPASSSNLSVQDVTIMEDLASGDYIEVRAFQSSGGDLVADTDEVFTWFWIQRVG